MTNNDNRRITEAIESIEPSDGAKERMLANIREKAAAQAASPAITPEASHRAVQPAQKQSRHRSGKTVWVRWVALAACFALIVTAVVIRGGKPGAAVSRSNINGKGSAEKDTAVYHDGVIGGRPAEAETDDIRGGAEYMPEPSYTSEPSMEPGRGYDHSDSTVVFTEKDEYGVVITEPNGEYSAGMLTAGEWKDAEAMSDWVKKLSENEEWADFVKQRGLDTSHYVKVTVTDGEAKCFNTKVELTDGENTLFTARTDINGCAYLFYSIHGETASPVQVKVGSTVQSVEGNTDLNIDAADAGMDVTALDLMLMVDTTGSMGDELEYLKAELSDMVQRISSETDGLSIRVSVNFYRDEGDEYVVKYFDFREDINDCLEQIKQQYADGGGDYPEAVHTALDNAVSGHTWREDAVKLCFIVLDAPPHSDQEVRGVNDSLRQSVLKAAELGIRIIPVASSGVDSETEYLLRSFALMTGGTYVFLTNDSGIGLEHKDPDIDETVTVELLNDCMVRIACEYCGMYSGEKVPYTPPQSEYHQ